jgi:hypothetical protein
MKKLFLLAVLSALTIGTMDSCNKKSAETKTSSFDKSNHSLMREDITWAEIQAGLNVDHLRERVYYGHVQGDDLNPGGFQCVGETGFCHFGAASTTNTIEWNPLINPTPTMRLTFIDPPMYGPAVPVTIHPGTFFTSTVKSAYGLSVGQIIPGTYPIIVTATYPLGYVDLPIIP